MISKKIILVLFPIFFLNACMSNSYYVLSTASQPAKIYAYKEGSIGVDKITVPEYLFKREIAIAKSSSQITLLNGAVWAEDLNAGLTQRLISFLQKKFQQPNVYLYPWGLNEQPINRVRVHITHFIFQDDYVYLDANWKVENLQIDKYKARLFSTKVATKDDATSIVSAMDKAFGELENQIALGINSLI